MQTPQAYDKDFFKDVHSSSIPSAQEIVPVVMEQVNPKSVVDVGCGTGAFLKIFEEHGVKSIFGVDGKYAEKQLVISPKNFKAFDLSKPFKLDKTYDLAITLEVGEHLPPESAKDFVRSLTRLAPIILFSAAAPLQGGTFHLNEQWPDYWAELFKKEGYAPVDAVRRRIWDNEKVAWWYRQNAILFCNAEALANNPALKDEAKFTSVHMLSVVHPQMYLQWQKVLNPSTMDKIRQKAKKIKVLRKAYHKIKKPFGFVTPD